MRLLGFSHKELENYSVQDIQNIVEARKRQINQQAQLFFTFFDYAFFTSKGSFDGKGKFKNGKYKEISNKFRSQFLNKTERKLTEKRIKELKKLNEYYLKHFEESQKAGKT